MNYEPYCAVCGRTVDPSSDHSKVDVETVRMDDRNEQDQYFLHEECAYRVLGGWEEP